MKNFTNNFKQFTSRLSARWLIMALMLLVGTSSAWGKTFYLNPKWSSDTWDKGGAWFLAWVWENGKDGSWRNATKGSKYYEIEVPDNANRVVWLRKSNSNSAQDWECLHRTGDVVMENGQNLTNITSWAPDDYNDKKYCPFTTDTYNPCTKPSAPSITINGGSSAKLCSESATITTTEVAGATAYNLYKDDSNTASQTNETGTFTVSEAGTYYVTVTTCAESPKQTTGVKLAYYSTPTLNNKYSKTNSTACGSTSHNNGTVTIEPEKDVTYTLTNVNTSYNKDGNTWINLSPGDYVLTATSTYCAELSVTERIEISEVDKTPTLNDISIKGGESVCQGGNLTLQLNGEAQDGVTYTWYKESKESEPVGNGSSLNLLNIQNDATYILVASKTSAEGCPASKETSKEITVNPLPAAPALTSPAPVCEGTKVNLPTEGLKWYDAATGGTEVQNTAIEATGTYWAAAMQNGCESATRTRYDVTVNPKPSIGSITQNVALPVPFEDVVLTANNVTDGAQVKWYVEENLVAENTNTYIVTSKTAGDVIVKAKAFLNGCESTAASHTVAFSAETCNNVADMTKIYLDVSENTGFITGNNAYVSVTASGNKSAKCGDTSGANQGNYIPKNDTWLGTMTKVAGENYIYEITIPNNVTINKGTTKLSFWNKSISSNSDVWEVQAILGQTISAGTNCMKLSNETKTHNDNRHSHLYCGTWTTYANKPAISAPAVKTVSFETTPGDGNINFSGQIVKTGCDNSLTYGYEYKKVGAANWTQVVLGTDLDKDAGFTFSDNNDKDLDGEYVVRAFITNDNSTQYGAEITKELSTTKDPVTKATIQLIDADGKEVDKNKKYCVGETGYIKVTSDVKYTTIKWKTDKGTEIEETGNNGVYPFVAKGDDNIWVMLSNKHNDIDRPAINENPLVINTFAVPVIPSIDIDKTTICSNDPTGAKIRVSNPQLDITYQVYKILGESEPTTHGEPKEYSEGVLEFNSMKEAGTYYVRAYNDEQCPNAIAQSLDEILTVIDAGATSISISPETKTVNPWVPVTFTVTKQGNYDYTFSCKEEGGENDVTSNMVINKSGDTYVVKFPKPDGASVATDLNGQVTFAKKRYKVEVKLNADVQCGTFEDESTVTLEPVNEICK